MNQEYFEKISDMIKKAQEPFQAIAELNVKTLQSFNYLKPDELAKFKNPGDFIEKQLELATINGRNALNYMQESYQIVEKAFVNSLKESEINKSKSKSKTDNGN